MAKYITKIPLLVNGKKYKVGVIVELNPKQAKSVKQHLTPIKEAKEEKK